MCVLWCSPWGVCVEVCFLGRVCGLARACACALLSVLCGSCVCVCVCVFLMVFVRWYGCICVCVCACVSFCVGEGAPWGVCVGLRVLVSVLW